MGIEQIHIVLITHRIDFKNLITLLPSVCSPLAYLLYKITGDEKKISNVVKRSVPLPIGQKRSFRSVLTLKYVEPFDAIGK